MDGCNEKSFKETHSVVDFMLQVKDFLLYIIFEIYHVLELCCLYFPHNLAENRNFYY